MEKFLQLTTAGIAVGGIYAIAALGFVLIYKATRVLNFAQGTLMMLGGYTAFAAATTWSLPLAVAIVVGTAITAATGAFMYVSSLDPVKRAGGNTEFAQVILTMAWALIITAVEVWTTDCGGRSELRETVQLKAGSGRDIARFN